MHNAGGELPRTLIRRSSRSGDSRKFALKEFCELRLYGVLGNSGRRDAGHAYQFIGNSSLPVII
jgi:hypothetical protein